MEYIFNIHYDLRKGLGPDWVHRTSTIGLDDLDPEITLEEVKQMAVNELKSMLHRNGTTEREYIITDVCQG